MKVPTDKDNLFEKIIDWGPVRGPIKFPNVLFQVALVFTTSVERSATLARTALENHLAKR